MRKTKIIATIGPSTRAINDLQHLIDAGCNVIRINMSHSSQKEADTLMEDVRTLSDEVALLVDTKGPEVRTTITTEPVTIEEGKEILIRGEQEGVYDVFDFKIHNVIGTDTAENLSRVFGERFKGFYKKRGKKHYPDDIIGDEAIWKKMKQRGFITMLGFDACAHKLHRVVGSAPNVDHVSEPYFCALTKFAQYNSAKKQGVNHAQRCVGDKMGHWYLLNYTMSFIDNY